MFLDSEKYVNRFVETEKSVVCGWFGEFAESTGSTVASKNPK